MARSSVDRLALMSERRTDDGAEKWFFRCVRRDDDTFLENFMTPPGLSNPSRRRRGLKGRT